MGRIPYEGDNLKVSQHTLPILGKAKEAAEESWELVMRTRVKPSSHKMIKIGISTKDLQSDTWQKAV